MSNYIKRVTKSTCRLRSALLISGFSLLFLQRVIILLLSP